VAVFCETRHVAFRKRFYVQGLGQTRVSRLRQVVAPRYSPRSAITGETLAARRAGIQLAKIVTATKVVAATAIVVRRIGLTTTLPDREPDAPRVDRNVSQTL
jgi:hypothetical protein